MITHRFHIPGVFDPSLSLLGRRMARRYGPVRGEARFYLVAIVAFLGLLVGDFFAWALIRDRVVGDPLGPAAVGFWLVQAGSLIAFVVGCVLGRRQPVDVLIDSVHVVVRQGDAAVRLRKHDIDSVEIVSALVFHRHYRHYAQVTSFAGGPALEHVLFRAGDEVVGIGVNAEIGQRIVRAVRQSERKATDPEIRLAL